MNFNTKANIGDTVYYLKRICKADCPICSGTGKIHIGKIGLNLNSEEDILNSLLNTSKEYTCPECNGKGKIKLVTDKQRYEVGSGIVCAIEMTAALTCNSTIYHVFDSSNDKNVNRTLSDDKVFLTQESAEKACEFKNLERHLVSIESIHIPKSFASKLPCNEKLMKRLDEWRDHRKFETEIYVDEDMNLFDGYTSFLVYRMLGSSEVPVAIWPKDKKK